MIVRALMSAALAAGCARGEGTAAAPALAFRELVRVGGADTGAASLDYVKGLDVDAAGRIHVYDRNSQDIRVFAPDGRHLRTIGRKGAGPGELGDAEGIRFASDGTLWIRDARNARFSVLDSLGQYVASWTQQFCTSQGPWDPVDDGATRLIDRDCAVVDGRGRGMIALGYHLDRSRVDTIGALATCGARELHEAATWVTRIPNGMSYRQIPYAPRPIEALGRGGDLWCAPDASRYEILRLRVGAADTTRIVRDFPPLTVSAAERDSVIREIESRGPTGLDFSRIPAVKPIVERLTVDDRGRLWVRRATDTGAIAFDVYDPEGRPLSSGALTGVRTSIWTPFIVRGDRLLLVALGEDDVAQVVVYEITGLARE